MSRRCGVRPPGGRPKKRPTRRRPRVIGWPPLSGLRRARRGNGWAAPVCVLHSGAVAQCPGIKPAREPTDGRHQHHPSTGTPCSISAMLTVNSPLRSMNSLVPSSGSTSQKRPPITSGSRPAATDSSATAGSNRPGSTPRQAHRPRSQARRRPCRAPKIGGVNRHRHLARFTRQLGQGFEQFSTVHPTFPARGWPKSFSKGTVR